MDKQKAKLAVYKAGAGVLIFILLSNLLALLIIALLNLIVNGSLSLSLPDLPETVSLCVDIFIAVVSLGASAYFLMGKAPSWEYQRPRPPFTSAALPLFFLIFAVSTIINTAGATFFDRLGYRWPDVAVVSDWSNTPVVLLAVLRFVIIPAVFEELFFRGAVLNSLAPRGELGAVVISALLFTAMHSNPGFWPGIFLLGLLFAYLTVKTRSILPSTLLHLLNNGIAMLSEYFASLEDTIYLSTLSGVFLGFGLMGALMSYSALATPEIRSNLRLDRGVLPVWQAIINPCVLIVVAYGVLTILLTAVKN